MVDQDGAAALLHDAIGNRHSFDILQRAQVRKLLFCNPPAPQVAYEKSATLVCFQNEFLSVDLTQKDIRLRLGAFCMNHPSGTGDRRCEKLVDILTPFVVLK